MSQTQIRNLNQCKVEPLPGKKFNKIATLSEIKFGRNAFYLCHLEGECSKKIPTGSVIYCSDSFPETGKNGEKK